MPNLLAGRRVLVVEDEVLVSWSTQDILAEYGCVVLPPTTSIAEALEAIATQSIDAAVLDVNLNGQFSYPVADALAQRGVPFVFVTGYATDRIAEPYRAVPALQKPLRRTELAAALAALLAPPASDVAAACA